MHNETSDRNAVRCITYIEKDESFKVESRWHITAILQVKVFYSKTSLRAKNIFYYDTFGNAFDHVIRVDFHFNYSGWQHLQLFCHLGNKWHVQVNSEYPRNAAMGSSCPTFYSLLWKNYLGQSFLPTVKSKKKVFSKRLKKSYSCFYMYPQK